MTTANNNGAAYAYRAGGLPTANFRLMFWHYASSGVVNNTDYSQFFEIAYGSGNYFQLYAPPFSATPELRYYRGEASEDAQILASTAFVEEWIRYLLTRTDDTWTLYVAAEGATSWTTVTSWTNATAPTSLCFMAGYLDLGDYLMPGGLLRSARCYTDDHSIADMLTDSLSATPTLSGQFFGWFEGATASLDGTDSTGNSRHATVVNSFVTSALDPITAGSTITAELGTDGVSTTAFTGSVTRTAGMGSAGVGVTAFTGSKLASVAVGSAGVGATSATARATRTVGANSDGVSTTAFDGKRTSGVSAQSDGVGATSFAGKRSLRAALSSAGEAVTSFVGRAVKLGGWASDGVGTTSFDGQTSAVTGAELDSDGVSTTAFAARVTRAAALASGGTATVGLAVRAHRRGIASSIGVSTTATTARATRTTAMGSDGVGSATITGRRTARAALGTDGAATVSYFGRTANAATVAFASAGVALVGFAGRVTRRGATQSNGVSTATATGRARMRGTLVTAGASLVSFAGRARVVGGWASAGASLVAFTANAIAATYATIWRLVPPVKRYRLVPPRKVYRVSSNTKWFPTFDPDARDYLELDLTEITLAKGSPIASATVTEVDTNDNPVGTPVLDLETPIVVTGTRVLVMAETHDDAPTETVCRLRFEYTHADTRRDHFTAFLPVKHQ